MKIKEMSREQIEALLQNNQPRVNPKETACAASALTIDKPGTPEAQCNLAAIANAVTGLAETSADLSDYFPSNEEYHQWAAQRGEYFPPYLKVGQVRMRSNIDFKSGLRVLHTARGILQEAPAYQAAAAPQVVAAVGPEERLVAITPPVDPVSVNTTFIAIVVWFTQPAQKVGQREVTVTIGYDPADPSTLFDNGTGLMRYASEADIVGSEEGTRRIPVYIDGVMAALIIPVTRKRLTEDRPAVRYGQFRALPSGSYLPINVRIKGFPTDPDFTVRAGLVTANSDAIADMSAAI